MRRPAPRPVAHAVEALAATLAPASPLAAVQSAWTAGAGSAVAREARPVAERGGVVTLACRSAVWAQELDLMGPEVIGRLNEVLGAPRVKALRCVTTRPGTGG